MSAIARYFKFKGYEVSGYDKTPSPLTARLEEEGIDIHYEDNVDYVPKDVEHTLVIYTPAIPHDMGELRYVMENGYRVMKRSAMLGEISKGQRCMAVAGTHGKTTTSTMTAHIFTDSGVGCSAFLGGISVNYNTNLLTSHTPVIVAEADEFDRSFLQLYPETAVITSMDADHLDIYSDVENMRKAFKEFAAQVSGTVIIKKGLDISPADTKARILTYSLYEDADFHAVGLSKDECGCFSFDLHSPFGVIEGLKCGTPGRVNAENSIAAAAIALVNGIDADGIRHALASFRGVNRRFEVHINRPSMAYIDDYAHHPAELSAAIDSIRDIFGDREITAIFQPHLYTRTRDFADEFAAALSKADRLILLDIYPAREEPIKGVTSKIIFNKVTCTDKVLITKEELMGYLSGLKPDVLITFGAGNIDRFIGPITDMFR